MRGVLRAVYWPPRALARWVNDAPGRTAIDRAFYEALYCAGWTAILLVCVTAGIGLAVQR